MSIKGFSVGGNVERYDYNFLDNLPSEITIDTALSGSSTNPVQNKVVTGAINATTDSVTALSGEVSDLKSAINDKAPVIIDTASGSIASFPDGADSIPVKNLTVAIEPVQDLHGYDHPWPAGGGVNIARPCYFPKCWCFTNCSLIILYIFTYKIKPIFVYFSHYTILYHFSFQNAIPIQRENARRAKN